MAGDAGREALLQGPVLLAPDNFTPLTRTPWGGKVIGARYKSELVPAARGTAIGESWEFSFGPDFPSRMVSAKDRTLADLAAAWPTEFFSAKALLAGRTRCEILVKLLDAAEPLSVQVHPADGDSALKKGECGKPESWLVLDAAPGAGLWLGFAKKISKAEVRAALTRPLASEADAAATARQLLNFVAVKAGDFFDIGPGVVHAIGPGVTLLEPQRVVQGQSGKTYRLWDWGRRYDAAGQPVKGADGSPRALHVEESLAVIDPERAFGPAYVETLRRSPQVVQAQGFEARVYPPNAWYQVCHVKASRGAAVPVAVDGGYAALTVLDGELTGAGGVRLATGQSALAAGGLFATEGGRAVAAKDTTYVLTYPTGATFRAAP